MTLNNSLLNKANITSLLFIILFYFFVSPFSIEVDGRGVSANYLFMLFPLLAFCINKEVAWPPKSVFLYMLMLSLIFFIGAIYQVEQYDLIIRRSASFIIVMGMFTFMFVKIDSNMIQSFKIAIVLWALWEALMTIIEFMTIDGNSQGFGAKRILGSQRIGFIYLMAFWPIIMFKAQNNASKIIKFILAFIVFSGLLMTYSRSSVVGLVASMGLYFLHILSTMFKGSESFRDSVLKVLSKLYFMFLLILLAFVLYPGTISYYKSTIWDYIFKSQVEDTQDTDLNLYNSWERYQKDLVELQRENETSKYEVRINLPPISQLEQKSSLTSVSPVQQLNSMLIDVDLKVKKASIKQAQVNVSSSDALDLPLKTEQEINKTPQLKIEAERTPKESLTEIKVEEKVLDDVIKVEEKVLDDVIKVEEKVLDDVIKVEEEVLDDLFKIEQENNKLLLLKNEAEKDGKELLTEIQNEIRLAAFQEKLAIEKASSLKLTAEYQRILAIQLALKEDILFNNSNTAADLFLINSIIMNVVTSDYYKEVQADIKSANYDLERIIKLENRMQGLVAQEWKKILQSTKTRDLDELNEIAKEVQDYQKYTAMEEVTYKAMASIQGDVDAAENNKIIILSKLILSELKTMRYDTEKLMALKLASREVMTMDTEINEVEESINIINQELNNIQKSILIMQSLETKRVSAIKSRISEKKSSVGYRYFIHKKVFTEVLKNPFTGSSFLGVWILFEEKTGAAHSQYLDTLFRIGIFGFIVYLLFLGKVTLFLHKKDLGLYLGFIALLVISLLHETIKLSQGGFIYAFLFAMWAQRKHILLK